MEGEFMGKQRQEATKMVRGERAAVVRHQDNLKMEGSFAGRKTETTKILKGERAEVQRHEDNLKMEGTFEGRLKEEALVGERVKAVKHSDNLRMEGSMDMKRDQGVVLPGERAQVTRHQDNLKMEGSMQLVSEAHSAGKAVQKVNYNTKVKQPVVAPPVKMSSLRLS